LLLVSIIRYVTLLRQLQRKGLYFSWYPKQEQTENDFPTTVSREDLYCQRHNSQTCRIRSTESDCVNKYLWIEF